MKVPGLSFSWKRALGVSKMKRDFAKATGIPTTRGGIERKIGKAVIDIVFGKRNEIRSIRGASVVRNQKASLLLGQSILGRLGSIELDNPGKKLIITHKR